MNYNVKITYFKTSVDGFVQSLLWFASALIVYSLGGDNTQFGAIAGIATLFSVIANLLAGTISDKLQRRDFFIWIGHVFLMLGMVMFAFANTIQIVLIASILVNGAFGFIMSNQTAIIADSTTSIEKNRIFSLLFLFNNLFSGVGNIIVFFIFTIYTNAVNTSTLLIIFRIGACLSIVQLMLAFLIRDSKSLKETVDYKNTGTINDFSRINGNINTSSTKTSSFFKKELFYLPFVVTISGYIIALGAGTSIIFLQIFFIRHYGVDPAFLSLIFALMIFFTAFWGKIMGDMADRFGRIKSIILTQLIATGLLYLLATYPPLVFAFVTLIDRNAFMNGSSPVSTALITDNVPKNFRGRWVALQVLGWGLFYSIGNIIGGALIDAYDFWSAFLVTATLYLIGTILIALIKEPNRRMQSIVAEEHLSVS